MNMFCYHLPCSMDEAVALRAQFGNSCVAVAGGTDIVPALHERQVCPEHVMDISKISEFKGISVQDGYLKIGSLTTFTELQNEPLICQYAQALYEAACSVGSPQIRNLGTLGGNIANASVAADSIAPLMSLDAELTLVSMLGLRNMAVCDFFAGERATALREHELIRDIRIPCSKMAQASTYVKLAKRKALAIVVLGLAIMLRCDDDGICTDARVVLGAVSRFPRRIINAEQMLIGQPVGEKAFDACIPVLSETVKQLIPNRASVGYKSESVRGAAKQAFNQIISALL
ncbi:FAD binding domain-containing protein [Lutispora sp.]|uniref:FAD binding domain-containing protein n=1 Tax=Lutispora sp. TaxID=2828727 RepID=UPI002B20C5BB|nr:FAD binding domain-containing protein [Lutispora sp.]MEA4962997.1 FAD binding domain-containing protein [Lutispora sp.]